MQELAQKALELQQQIKPLVDQLDNIKENLRVLANSEKHEIVVPNLGTVTISSPRSSSQKVVLEVNLDKVEKSGLKDKLIEKGILQQKTVMTKAAKASVSIKLNV